MLVSHENLDLMGVCSSCGGVLIRNNSQVYLNGWCACKDGKIEQELFYQKENGNHGWFHTICGKITQVG